MHASASTPLPGDKSTTALTVKSSKNGSQKSKFCPIHPIERRPPTPEHHDPFPRHLAVPVVHKLLLLNGSAGQLRTRLHRDAHVGRAAGFRRHDFWGGGSRTPGIDRTRLAVRTQNHLMSVAAPPQSAQMSPTMVDCGPNLAQVPRGRPQIGPRKPTLAPLSCIGARVRRVFVSPALAAAFHVLPEVVRCTAAAGPDKLVRRTDEEWLSGAAAEMQWRSNDAARLARVGFERLAELRAGLALLLEWAGKMFASSCRRPVGAHES